MIHRRSPGALDWGIVATRSDPTALVGRRAELGAVDIALSERRCAWVSGLGGVGKTRLAREILGQRGGAWVDVGPVAEPAALGPAIAAAVGFPQGSRPTPGGVASWVGAQGLPLLVLDDVDAVVDAARVWVEVLLPQVPVLVTSRMAGPDGFDVPIGALDPDGDGAALFWSRVPARRAGAADPTRPDHVAAVRTLAASLGGLPLAIELAAARLAVLPLDRLLTEIDRSLVLLRDPVHAERQARSGSVEATLRWSWERLPEDQARTLSAAATFDGPAPAEAIAAVCGEPEAALLDPLHALVLLHLIEPAGTDDVRFTTHPLVRRFARDRLQERPEAWADAIRRHARWVGAQAAAAIRALHQVGDRASFTAARRLAAECRGVVSRGEADPDALAPDDVCHAALLLWDLDQEFRQQSDALRAVASRATPALCLALLKRSVATHIRAGAFDRAEADAARGAELADAERRAEFVARGAAARLARDPTDAEAVAAIDRALEAARAADAPRAVGDILGLRAIYVRAPRGDHTGALQDKLARLDLVSHEPIAEAQALDSVGVALVTAGRLDEAEARFERALDRFDRAGLVGAAAEVRGRLASVRMLRGELDAAAALLDLAVADAARVGDRANHAYHRALRGLLAVERGDDAAALLDALRPTDLQGSWIGPRLVLHCARACAAYDRGEPLPAPLTVDARLDPEVVRTAEAVDRVLALLVEARGRLGAHDREGCVAALTAAEASVEPVASTWGLGRLFARIARARAGGLRLRLGAWRVAADGSRFAPPGGAWVDLSNRPMLVRLVGALARGPRTLTEIGDVVWPGERMVADSLQNRIRVAVSTLRKLGLSILETTDGGYRLRPDIAVEIA